MEMFFADVIFPAFSAPYLSLLFFPIAALLAISSEIFTFKCRYKSLPLSRTVWITLVANFVSWMIGLLLSLVLPSGLVPKIMRSGFKTIAPGPHFQVFVICGFIVAFILSIVIEYFVWKRLSKKSPLPSLSVTSFIAHIASYGILILIAYLYIHFNWW